MTSSLVAVPEVAVVIVSFEAREALLECLAGLLPTAPMPLEVVVVDNASTDNTPSAVVERHPSVRVIRNALNRGFAEACNQGIQATTAPRVLILNPDTAISPDAVVGLVAALDARDDCALVAPRLVDDEGVVEISTGAPLGLRTELRQRRLVRGLRARRPWAVERAERLHSTEHEPGWVSGACFIARREALVSVGAFDTDFFLYEEDVDLCQRLRGNGRRLLFTPKITVRHRRGVSMSRTPLAARLAYHDSHLHYYDKHCGIASRALLRLWLLAQAAVVALLSLLRPSRGAEARHLARLALLGWGRGALRLDRARPTC